MIISTNKNTLKAYGTIWPSDGVYFVSSLQQLELSYDEITVRLHTVGGSVFDGNLIYNALNASKSNITIIIDGIAASMGSIIMLSRQQVKIVENGYVMIHAPRSSSQGTAQELEQQANLLRKVEANFKDKLITKTGKSEKEVANWLVGDNWFDAKDCLAMGLVSEIIPAVVETPLLAEPTQMEQQEVFNMYACLLTHNANDNFNIEIDMKQPLITALGLVDVTALSSDTAIIEAVSAQIKQANDARATAETALQAFKETQITAVLDEAEKAGTLKKEQREVYATIGKTAGIESLIAVLGNAKPTAPNLSALLQNGAATNTEVKASWDFDKWQKEDPKGLEVLAKENPADFNKLFNAKYNK
jgi:ATP-dependent Clp protease, protease subunit